ncbi:ethanolamine utilization protein EutQ [Vibrio sp. M60_M31a]
MKQVKLVDSKTLDFNVRGDTPGMAYVARALSPEISPNIGVGFAKWEGAEVAWTVLYDEVVFVIEGCFELTANGETHFVRPGQMLWIPEGTGVSLWRTRVIWLCCTRGNWKELHGIE